jgi:hypothetical protein
VVQVDLDQLGNNMSRSTKKTPITGWTSANSEAADKKIWHKRMRSKIKHMITAAHNDIDSLSDTVFPIENEIINPVTMDKDGKQYVSKLSKWFNKIMRK